MLSKINRRCFLEINFLSGLYFLLSFSAFDFLKNPKVSFIGIGGAGLCFNDFLIRSKFGEKALCVSIDTDSESLKHNKAHKKIYLDNLGQFEKKNLKKLIENSKTTCIISGLGGRTGSILSSIVAGMSNKLGNKTLSLGFFPFYFEGESRVRRAQKTLQDLRKNSDSVIVLPLNMLRTYSSINNNDSIFVVFEVGYKLALRYLGPFTKIIYD